MGLAVTVLADRIADLATLSYGGEPRVVACACEISEDEGATWRTLSIMVGGGRYPGSALDRLAHGSGLLAFDPTAVWGLAASDMRLSLWLSLFRSAAGERRWDARIFRVCSLLETVAAALVTRPEALSDLDGVVLLDHEGRPATTDGAWGKVYVLVRNSLSILKVDHRVLLAHPTRALWDEVGVWRDVRNAVAHEGAWPSPPHDTRRPARRDRVAVAFELLTGRSK